MNKFLTKKNYIILVFLLISVITFYYFLFIKNKPYKIASPSQPKIVSEMESIHKLDSKNIPIEKLSQCTGYFEPSALPPHGVFGIIEEKNLNNHTIIINNQEIDLSSLTHVQVFVIKNKKKYAQGLLGSFELLNHNYNVNDFLENISIGANVWVATSENGLILRLHCSIKDLT